MEITLDDLTVLEPNLAWAARGWTASEIATKEREVVSWAVSARSTAPHLPQLRGGEVLLIPPRVTAAVRGELPALLREAKLRDVAAVVFERDEPGLANNHSIDNGVTVLSWDGHLTQDTEAAINRLLTECRGNLYSVGSELERQMTDLAANGSGLRTLVQTTSDLSGLPIQVVDAQGRLLATSRQEQDVSDAAADPGEETRIERTLPSGSSLILGPLRSEQRVVGRFLIDRIATAVALAARRDEAVRPRGARRVEAVEALLAGRGDPGEQRAAALALGLDPDAMFFVAVSSGKNEATLTSALGPLGTIHAAGEANGRRTSVIAAPGRMDSEGLHNRVAEVKRRWHDETGGTSATLAISAPASGVAHLPLAASEATFVATLQAQPRFSQRAASFDSIDDIGVFRLLYPLRGTSELRQFVAVALGTVERRDQRGTLRETLRAYLEAGGSQANASQQLGIHRNTLAYRLQRITELIGRDVSDPRLWLTLHLALRASDLLEVYADDQQISQQHT